MFCRNCGTKLSDEQRFCHCCGAENSSAVPTAQASNEPTPANQPPAMPPYNPTQSLYGTAPAPNQKKSFKKILIPCIALLCVLAIIILSCVMHSTPSSDSRKNFQISAASTSTYAVMQSSKRVARAGATSDNEKDVTNWSDIVAVGGGFAHAVGLKTDGTVVATVPTDRYNYGQSAVLDWTDITAISASDHHTVGLKKDGTVVSTTIQVPEGKSAEEYDD